MGYTHYWRFKNNTLSQRAMNKIAKDMRVIEKALSKGNVSSDIAGGFFHDKFVVLGDYGGNSEGVCYHGNATNTIEFGFNGMGDLSHETFAINVGENEWNFCKTARKPYDLAVCLILLSIKYHTKSTKITSDGNTGDWKPAFDVFNELFPNRSVSFRFKEWDNDDPKLDGSLVIEKSEKVLA